MWEEVWLKWPSGSESVVSIVFQFPIFSSHLLKKIFNTPTNMSKISLYCNGVGCFHSQMVIDLFK